MHVSPQYIELADGPPIVYGIRAGQADFYVSRCLRRAWQQDHFRAEPYVDIVQFDLCKRNSILRYFNHVRAGIIICIVLQHYFVEVLCLAEID